MLKPNIKIMSSTKVVDNMEVIEKTISSWRKKDKYPCPKCGKKLGMPEYKCVPCNLKIKLKMRF